MLLIHDPKKMNPKKW